LARQKSFAKLNHALQAVQLSQIVKADFKTDTLSLRRGAPKSFDGIYLQLFRKEVLLPLLRLLENRDSSLKAFAKEQLEFITLNLLPQFKADL
jgi:hypothetical protein